LRGFEFRLGLGQSFHGTWTDVGAFPIQGGIGAIVGGQSPYASYHRFELPVFICLFYYPFSRRKGFILGFCFGRCYESSTGKEGVCKLEKIPGIKVSSWPLVRTLVEEVGEKDVLVVGMEPLPKELIALSLGHETGEKKGVA